MHPASKPYAWQAGTCRTRMETRPPGGEGEGATFHLLFKRGQNISSDLAYQSARDRHGKPGPMERTGTETLVSDWCRLNVALCFLTFTTLRRGFTMPAPAAPAQSFNAKTQSNRPHTTETNGDVLGFLRRGPSDAPVTADVDVPDSRESGLRRRPCCSLQRVWQGHKPRCTQLANLHANIKCHCRQFLRLCCKEVSRRRLCCYLVIRACLAHSEGVLTCHSELWQAVCNGSEYPCVSTMKCPCQQLVRPAGKEVIQTEEKALGPYSPGIKAGNTLYISGQIGLKPGVRRTGFPWHTLSSSSQEQKHKR